MAKKKMAEKSHYAAAGVDIDAGNRLVEFLKPIVGKTFKSGVITDIGGFAGVFSLNVEHLKKPVLVSSTDGVGTKLRIAFMLDKHDTVGIDLVAMKAGCRQGAGDCKGHCRRLFGSQLLPHRR